MWYAKLLQLRQVDFISCNIAVFTITIRMKQSRNRLTVAKVAEYTT